MFGLSAFNRLLRARQQQQERPVLNASDALSAKQMEAGIKALRLLKLHKSLDALTRDDLMDFLFAVGMNPTPDVLEGKLRLLRVHKQQAFTWGELAHVWSMLLRDAANEDQILDRAFAFFDKDGNGEISVSELRTTMSELGDLLTEEEICAFIAIMDVDNDGVIGYQEFLHTLRSEVPQLAKGPSRRTLDEQAEYNGLIEAVYSGSGAKQQGQQLQRHTTGSENLSSRCTAALDKDPSTPTSPESAAAALSSPRHSKCSHTAGAETLVLQPLHLKLQPRTQNLQESCSTRHLMQQHDAQQQQQQRGIVHMEQHREQQQEQLASPRTQSPRQQQQQSHGLPQQQQQQDEQSPSPWHWSPRPQQQQLVDEQLLASSRQHKPKHIRYQDELQEDAMTLAVNHVPANSGDTDMCQPDSLPGQTQDCESHSAAE